MQLEDIIEHDDDFYGAALMAGLTNVWLGGVAEENQNLIQSLSSYDPIKTAATVAGLLTTPELQCNSVRLETLVHLIITNAHGRQKPQCSTLNQWFSALGEGFCGRMEDPAEDIFVSLVHTPRGNYRIFEGIWEGAGFFLQRFLNIIENMPEGEPYKSLRNNVEALLKLSEAVADRAKIQRHTLGDVFPREHIPNLFKNKLSSLRRRITFTEQELEKLHIPLDLLAPFTFDPNNRNSLLEQCLGHTSLERQPLAYHNNKIHLLLPTAISATIRRHIIEWMQSTGFTNNFETALAREYEELLSELPLLGSLRNAPVRFQKVKSGYYASVMKQADKGRFINFVFFADNIGGFDKEGLNSINSNGKEITECIEKYIELSSQKAREQDDFRAGVTIIISCGWGRSVSRNIIERKFENWRIESISAHDLLTLSWLNNFKSLSLWRLLDAQDALKKHNVTIHNVNGLLNLVAWVQSLDGHLVPHGNMPDEFAADDNTPTFLMIEQNSLVTLRHKVVMGWDAHQAIGVEGNSVLVRKEGNSIFEEDNHRPYYISEDDVREGKLRGVFETAHRSWWLSIHPPETASRHSTFETFKMLGVWLSRSVPVLEKEFKNLPEDSIVWNVTFTELGNCGPAIEPPEINSLRSLIHPSADRRDNSFALSVDANFEHGLSHPHNIAEQVIVEGMIRGVALLADKELDEEQLEKILSKIVLSPDARNMHRFYANSYRDYVREALPNDPITIDKIDEGILKLGLGWRVRSKSEGNEIIGKDECVRYLNSLVTELESELCEALRTFNRQAFLKRMLINHETAAVDRDLWRRTSRAVMAFHDDKMATTNTIIKKDHALNATFLASRILTEIGLCECSLEGGLEPGELDMSRMMAIVLSIFHYAGWSNAIRLEAMEAKLKITALGDVHMNPSFIDSVMQPFGNTGSEIQVKQAIKKYEKHYTEHKPRKSTEDGFPKEFLDAWREEFGATVDEMRLFVDYLEDVGIKKREAILTLKQSEISEIKTHEGNGLSKDTISAIISAFSLAPRDNWSVVPDGYEDKDRQIWRFKRRLSMMRRPLLQLDDKPDPTFLIAPGVVRESLAYTVSNFYDGEFGNQNANSKAMKQWVGKANDQQRTEFNAMVAERMVELGWNAKAEVKVTELLGQGFDRNYGDVDVLAWRTDSGRVLLMECKDLHYKKTYGEIAEQLSDFRGEVRTITRKGKIKEESDLLKKHIDRVGIINNHLDAVEKYTGTKPQTAEGYMVFRNPVPMQFIWDKMQHLVDVCIYNDLDSRFS